MPRLAAKITLLFFVFACSIFQVLGQHETVNKESSSEEKKFNAGKFVIEHVSDAHEWHITSVGSFHLSIPLPVILYSKNPHLHGGKNLDIFMSS